MIVFIRICEIVLIYIRLCLYVRLCLYMDLFDMFFPITGNALEWHLNFTAESVKVTIMIKTRLLFQPHQSKFQGWRGLHVIWLC